MNEEKVLKRGFSIIEYSKSGVDAILKTFYRFPLTIILFIALAVVIIYRVETPYNESIYEMLDRLTSIIVLGITLSLAVEVLMERFFKKDNMLIKILIYVFELFLLTMYYVFLYTNTDFVSTERLFLFIIALTLSFLFVPYLLKKEAFEIYITKIITRIIVTGFFTIVLGLGLSATLFAIQSLLYNDLRSELYAYVWAFSGCLFASIYFLYGLPKRTDSFNLDSYNKVIQVLLLYIIMPLLGIYTAVLYVYFAKILITQVWPEGIVSYLVLSYTAVGIMAIFLVSPLKDENKWAKVFILLYSKLIFPLLAMMFVSIGIRINEYGFTENRYFIVIIGIWATFAMIYIFFNKSRNNVVLAISLALVAFISVWGPWSAFNISIASQNERFYDIVLKYDMVQNGEVINNNAMLEREDQKEVVGILQYFDRYHKLDDLKYLPDDFTLEKMKELFGFGQEAWYIDRDSESYISYYNMDNKPLQITGYDIHYFIRLYEYDLEDIEKGLIYEGSFFEINVIDENILILYKDGNEIYRYDIEGYIKNLYDEYGANTSKEGWDNTEYLLVNDENNIVKVMFDFNQIYANINHSNESLNDINVEADIYVDIK